MRTPRGPRKLPATALFIQVDELSSEFWPCSFVFVFEEHESRLPLLRANAFRPGGEICLGIVDASQTQVTPVGSLVDVIRRQVVSIRNTQRAALAAQQCEHVVVKPGRMTKLERRPSLRG